MTNRDILDELRVRGELVERLKRIAPRSREIINLLYGLSFETGLIVRGEMTMEQVAKLYSITNERVRQIERRVFKELSEGLIDSPWHTGIPTEEGCFYALQCKGYTHPELYFGVVVNGVFSAINGDGDLMPLPPDLIAWQKITPYEEKEK